MSKQRFPRRLPLDQPPPLEGRLVDGRRTPMYVLAWVCPPRKLYENLAGGPLGTVSDCNLRDVVSEKWAAFPDFDFALHPMAYYGIDGNYYLIAMFNNRKTNHINRVRDVAGDDLIHSARVSMGVDKDPSLETTLQWFRYPPRY
ncbi:hypothetical protein DFH06DRAFT_1425448 [Mycena polygramma]|nr:hypothetical protein DFH06DRAFT_1425448 [Mycena polygramma]